MEIKVAFARCKLSNLLRICYFNQINRCALFSSSTDIFLENLLLEGASKRENVLLKYFDHQKRSARKLKMNETNDFTSVLDKKRVDLVSCIEAEIKGESRVPNCKLNHLLVCYAKNGDVNGVKAVQFIVKKSNISYFKSQSEYNHFLAEALWIDGKIEESLELFTVAYNNCTIRPKVKLMLKCLFPLLIIRHSQGTLFKTVHAIEEFSTEKQDYIILAYLWRELFQSTWFTDQQLAIKILEKNGNLLQIIQWMIPNMAKKCLKDHNINDFYRLIELTLANGLTKLGGILIRLLFDYYYIHENIERCSAVVKYSSDSDSPLTEDQQRQYVDLLLKSRNSVNSKLNVKKPQNLKYKF